QFHFGGVLGYVDTIDHSAAGSEGEDSAQHLDDRGFTGPVGAEKPEHLSWLDLKADTIDGRDVAELSNEVFRENGGHQFTSWNLTSALMPARRLLGGVSSRRFTPPTLGWPFSFFFTFRWQHICLCPN